VIAKSQQHFSSGTQRIHHRDHFSASHSDVSWDESFGSIPTIIWLILVILPGDATEKNPENTVGHVRLAIWR
jgi:hypothetical protein